MIVLVHFLRKMNNNYEIINGLIGGEKKYVWAFEGRNYVNA